MLDATAGSYYPGQAKLIALIGQWSPPTRKIWRHYFVCVGLIRTKFVRSTQNRTPMIRKRPKSNRI